MGHRNYNHYKFRNMPCYKIQNNCKIMIYRRFAKNVNEIACAEITGKKLILNFKPTDTRGHLGKLSFLIAFS